MLYNVTAITWVEEPSWYEPYHENRDVAYTNLERSEADILAEDLVEMWTFPETGHVNRFNNGDDHGAYVEDRITGRAHGIRVTVRPQ